MQRVPGTEYRTGPLKRSYFDVSTFRRFDVYTSHMRKPGTDANNVQMSDVLCDFCQREWTEDVPMLEGHHGSCICGKCLSVAYAEVVLNGASTAPAEYSCPMCLEQTKDRASMDRVEEGGWQSPLRDEAVICKRCIDLAATALTKDKESGWTKPTRAGVEQ